MANICIVLGKTGTGKSTSIKGLDPKDTIVINVLNKLLPFRGSKSMYSEGNKNLFRVTDYVKTIALLSSINKQEYVKNVVIDDAIFEMEQLQKLEKANAAAEAATMQGTTQAAQTAQKSADAANTAAAENPSAATVTSEAVASDMAN